jgi:hypothetical protein
MESMAKSAIPSKRVVVAVVLALASFGVPAAIMTTTVTGESAPVAACTTGEEEDTFTTTCVPFMVPNSPQGFTTTAANPDIPEIDGIPCTGRDSGACIGLSEDQAAAGPQPVPRSTISSSP